MNERINKSLRLKIIERFGTQADFAQTMGVDEALVSRVVRRRRTLQEPERARWAKALKCKPSEIFQSN